MSLPSEAPSAAERFASGLPFPLDRFQVEALEAVEAGESVLVAAPTGSGKTVVAEFACWLVRETTGKCFYTTPIKALSNQKFGDLVARHGARNVGLLTGDNTINGEAPIVVMTTEVLRNMIYEGSSTLEGLRWVVMDEVHYLQDPYRGAVWEEVLIHLPTDVRVVSLSATVSNVEEFGDWIQTLRGTTRVIVERTRPVELRNLAMVGEEIFPLFADATDASTGMTDATSRGRRRGAKAGAGHQVNPELARAWAKGTAAAARYGHHVGRRRRPGERVYTPTRFEVAEVLRAEKMLPAIVFIFSRVGCDKAVEQCVFSDLRLTSPEEAERIEEFAELRAADIDPDDLAALRWNTFLDGLRRGVAAHHAGMLPIFKETVEELFAIGLLKLVFATETLALGINMPAKTVVIERLTKFTGDRHEMLTPTDYTQLTGRAGRRGIDDLGYAVVLYNPWVGLDKISTLATVRAYELTSSFRPSYNMAVNLVRNYTEETAAHLLNSSFAQYATNREVVRWEKELATREREVAELTEAAACERGDVVEYVRLREEADEAARTRRGSAEVKQAVSRLVPGDVIWGDGLGKALVVEPPKTAKGGGGPRLTVMTADRKLRRVTPRDFRVPPQPVAKMAVRGQGWRSAKVRRHLSRDLTQLDIERPPPGPDVDELHRRVAAYEAHPVHGCPDIGDHVRHAERLARARKDADRLRRRVRREKDTISRTFERVLKVLRELGHVDGWELTAKGRLLAQVYNESDLLVVEWLDRGWYRGLTPEELVAVASMFVYEPRGRDEPEDPPTPELAKHARRISNLYDSVAEIEDRERIELLKQPEVGFMSTIYEWATGGSLDAVLTERGKSAGDFVRQAKQVLDLLQQLRPVARTLDDDQLGDTLKQAVDAVQRGVVAYSSVV